VSVIRDHLLHAAGRGLKGKLSIFGLVLLPCYLVVTLVGSIVGNSQPTLLKSGTAGGVTLCSFIAFFMCIVSSALLIVVHSNNDWVQPLVRPVARAANAITTEDVKSALRVIPIVLCINIGFNVGYNGMDIYAVAACQMDVRVPQVQWLRNVLLLPKGQFNGNFYSLGNNGAIILFVPLLEGLILPMMRRARNGRQIPRKAKYITGFILVILSNVCGMILEYIRRQRPLIPCPAGSEGSDICGPYRDTSEGAPEYLYSQCSPGGHIPMSDMSAWWVIIPYFITGCGEVLVNPVVQEFAFDESSSKLRSFVMGFTLVAMGCVPSVITSVFSGFVPNDMNSGPVQWCYMANNIVSILLLLAYFFIAIPDKQDRVPETAAANQDALLEDGNNDASG